MLNGSYTWARILLSGALMKLSKAITVVVGGGPTGVELVSTPPSLSAPSPLADVD